MHAHAHALLLISRQLVVVHKHRLKLVAQILMQHAHAVTKHNPIVSLVKQNEVQPLIVSQQIVLIIHHRIVVLTRQNESLLIAEPHKQQMLLPVQDKLIPADQLAQMTGEVQIEQIAQHQTVCPILHNEFKQTVV
jgi:hypothetical protein